MSDSAISWTAAPQASLSFTISQSLLKLMSITAKSLQSCPTLCDPIDGSPSGSPVPGILQARTLEWVAISFSNAWKWKWSHSVMSDFSRPHGLQPSRVLCPWDFPGKSTGVGCHCLLHHVFLTSCLNGPVKFGFKFHKDAFWILIVFLRILL